MCHVRSTARADLIEVPEEAEDMQLVDRQNEPGKGAWDR
jgi:hypothetical protein